jgi:3D (Asp-Asp-Asp) domain-containing protein
VKPINNKKLFIFYASCVFLFGCGKSVPNTAHFPANKNKFTQIQYSADVASSYEKNSQNGSESNSAKNSDSTSMPVQTEDIISTNNNSATVVEATTGVADRSTSANQGGEVVKSSGKIEPSEIKKQKTDYQAQTSYASDHPEQDLQKNKLTNKNLTPTTSTSQPGVAMPKKSASQTKDKTQSPVRSTGVVTPSSKERAPSNESNQQNEIPAAKKSIAAELKPTVYYLPRFDKADQNCSSSDLKDIKSSDGKILATLCERAYSICRMQGSCFYTDRSVNKLINVSGQPFEVDTNKCPYGYGVRNICLDPYYSVAADLNYFNPGDVIYVDKVRGTKLPNGDVHTGYFLVRDTGGAIKGRHRFDFFSGTQSPYSDNNPFTMLGLVDPNNRFKYVKVNGKYADLFLQQRQFPLAPSSR